METTASPAMTTPRSRRWSSVSSRLSSSSASLIGWSSLDSCERIRRPRPRQRKGHAFAGVAPGQFLPKLFQPRFFIAIEQNVDLRKRAGTLLPRFGDRVARELVHDGALDLRHHLLFGVARRAFLLVI